MALVHGTRVRGIGSELLQKLLASGLFALIEPLIAKVLQ